MVGYMRTVSVLLYGFVSVLSYWVQCSFDHEGVPVREMAVQVHSKYVLIPSKLRFQRSRNWE